MGETLGRTKALAVGVPRNAARPHGRTHRAAKPLHTRDTDPEDVQVPVAPAQRVTDRMGTRFSGSRNPAARGKVGAGARPNSEGSIRDASRIRMPHASPAPSRSYSQSAASTALRGPVRPAGPRMSSGIIPTRLLIDTKTLLINTFTSCRSFNAIKIPYLMALNYGAKGAAFSLPLPSTITVQWFCARVMPL